MRGLDRGEEPSDQQPVERAAVKPVVFKVVGARELAREIAEQPLVPSAERPPLVAEMRLYAEDSFEFEADKHHDLEDADYLDEPLERFVSNLQSANFQSFMLPADEGRPLLAASQSAPAVRPTRRRPRDSTQVSDDAQLRALRAEVDELRHQLQQSNEEHDATFESLQTARDEKSSLEQQLKETKSELAKSRTAAGQSEHQANEARSQAKRLKREAEDARQARTAAEAQSQAVSADLAERRRANAPGVADVKSAFKQELADWQERIERAQRDLVGRLTAEQRAAAKLHAAELGVAEDALDLDTVTTVTEALNAFDLIQEQGGAPLVAIPRSATTRVAELDAHPLARAYAQRTLDGLLALYLFALAKARRQKGIGSNFWDWCKRSDNPFKWQANERKLAMKESESTMKDPRLAATRIFPIDERVGRFTTKRMEPHIKISNGGVRPRLHFHDDTNGNTKQMHVGYIGPHLPTSQEN